MRSVFITALMGCLFFVSSPARAEGRYEGDWIMKAMSLDVAVDSWGKDCGVKPRSYKNAASTPVEIRETDGYLIFSKGNIRTDACGSLNPKVQSVLAKRTATRWKRICKTAADDPKSEQGEYVLEALDDNHLEYIAVSKFDWALKGDHCIARSTERRTYVRVSAVQPADPLPPKNEEVQAPVKETIGIETGCKALGPTAKVEISPKSAVIGPGERVCLVATAYDAEGCKTENNAEVSWSATQDGRAIPHLISKLGCFQAGDTAADAEGMYLVTARLAGKSATAEVSVVFPDLGDLFAARISPLENESAPTNKATKDHLNAAAPSPPTLASANALARISPVSSTASPASAEDHTVRNLLIVLFAAAAIIGIVLIKFLWIRRRRRIQNDLDEEFDELPETPPPAKKMIEKNLEMQHSIQPTARVRGMICPVCEKTFDMFAKFCPYDKNDLLPIRPEMKEMPTGMICPKCHRGYDDGARFCPHDAAQLIPYSEWRLSKLPPAP